MDQGWIGPATRVMCGGAFGLAMVMAGVRFLSRKMRALGQGLIGGGLAVVYVSIYAAHSYYELVPLPVALGLLAVATAGGMILSVWHKAFPVSLLATLGGFLTPLILWTGLEERDALFTYLVVLDVGVLAVAARQRWRSLDAAAHGATWTYFAVWYQETGSRDPVATTLWLGGFFALFGIAPYARHLIKRTPIYAERVVMAVIGAVTTIAHATDLLYDHHPIEFGLFVAGLAAVLLGLAAALRRLVPEDRRGLFTMVVLGAGAATAALPGFLEQGALTVGFAIEGVVLVFLAHRLRYLPVRIAALVPIGIAAVRSFAVHGPTHGYGASHAPVFNPEFLTIAAFALALIGYAVVQWAHRGQGGALDRVLLHVAAHAGAFFCMGLLTAEIVGWLEFEGEHHLAHALAPLPWAVGALTYLAWTRRDRSTVIRAHGLGALIIAGGIAAWVYAFGDQPPSSDWLVLNWRCAVALAVVAAIGGFAFERLRRPAEEGGAQTTGKVILGCALGALLTLLSVEVFQFFAERAPHPLVGDRAAQTALSVLWSAFAAAVLTFGIALGKRPLRFAALALLGITAVKLMAVDLAVLRDAYRIVSFVVLGLVMLGVSYLYHKLERRLASAPAQRQGG
jgi:uncharacterized membrane protein